MRKPVTECWRCGYTDAPKEEIHQRGTFKGLCKDRDACRERLDELLKITCPACGHRFKHEDEPVS